MLLKQMMKSGHHNMMLLLPAGHLSVQYILQCKADLSERRSMALADNLHVLWEPRLD